MSEIPEDAPLSNNNSSLCLPSSFLQFLFCVLDKGPDYLPLLLSAGIVVDPLDRSTFSDILKTSWRMNFFILTHSNHLLFAPSVTLSFPSDQLLDNLAVGPYCHHFGFGSPNWRNLYS